MTYNETHSSDMGHELDKVRSVNMQSIQMVISYMPTRPVIVRTGTLKRNSWERISGRSRRKNMQH